MNGSDQTNPWYILSHLDLYSDSYSRNNNNYSNTYNNAQSSYRHTKTPSTAKYNRPPQKEISYSELKVHPQ